MSETSSTRVARDLHMLAALTKRVLEGDVSGPTGVSASFTQIVILKWLDAATPRRAQDVARFLSASAPAATQILARLRKKGLIRSKPSAADRRAEDLFLTPKARALVKRYEALKSKRLDRLLGDLPEAKLRLVTQGLEAAIEMLLADKPEVEDMCLHCGAYESPQCVMRQHGFKCPTEREGLEACGTPEKPVAAAGKQG